MLSKTLLIVAALVAVLAASFSLATEQIAITECSDAECKSGCKTVAKLTAGQCHSSHFRHDSSFDVKCVPVKPGTLCLYEALYNLSSTTPSASCVEDNIKMLANRECGVCMPEHPMHRVNHSAPVKYEIFDGCSSASTLAIKMGCDKTCTTCEHTHKIAEKTCINPPHMKFAVAFSAPARCPTKAIASTHYSNSSTCAGTGEAQMTLSDSCYSRGKSRWGKVHSHYYHCL